jgi:homoserine kinase type II
MSADTTLFSASSLARLLAEHWGQPTAEITAHEGGMSSLTWVVTQGSQRWLAKVVSTDRYGQQFAAGLAAAARLSAAGIPAGAPVPTREGALCVEADGASVALLSWVEGSPVEQHTIAGMETVGRTLARAHLALGETPARTQIEPYLDPTRPHLSIRPWIRPALTAAHAAVEAEEALPPAEVERALATMLRWRWATQAYYFARRIATNDMTGIDGPADNERGLAHAEYYLDPPHVSAP